MWGEGCSVPAPGRVPALTGGRTWMGGGRSSSQASTHVVRGSAGVGGAAGKQQHRWGRVLVGWRSSGGGACRGLSPRAVGPKWPDWPPTWGGVGPRAPGWQCAGGDDALARPVVKSQGTPQWRESSTAQHSRGERSETRGPPRGRPHPGKHGPNRGAAHTRPSPKRKQNAANTRRAPVLLP